MLLLECCSYRFNIPPELAAIIRAYYRQPLCNNSIREAINMWCVEALSDDEEVKKTMLKMKERDEEVKEEKESVFSKRERCLLRYGFISDWDTSQVTDMNQLFCRKETFNDDISDWDVSNVTTMKQMFWKAPSFNQSLEEWSVEKVTDMSGMFYDASDFNKPLTRWNVSNVKTMSNMFQSALGGTEG
jgi:surface protein